MTTNSKITSSKKPPENKRNGNSSANKTQCRARYHVKKDQIEFDWRNADAPGCNPQGNQLVKRHELPGGLNGLSNRCYDADRFGGIGAWVDLQESEMVIYGVKRI